MGLQQERLKLYAQQVSETDLADEAWEKQGGSEQTTQDWLNTEKQ